MEKFLRIVLGSAMVFIAILAIVAPELVPVDVSLPIKIASIAFGIWLISGWMREQAYFVLRILIGATFVFAAVDKVFHPDQFARIIYNYHILPGQFINAFALLLPWIELIAGVFIIVGYWEKVSALIIGGLLAMFIVALSMALVKGVNIECGCFSTTSRAKGPVKDLIIRDAVLLIGCALIFVASRNWLALERRRPRR